jgi:hypothetical protein
MECLFGAVYSPHTARFTLDSQEVQSVESAQTPRRIAHTMFIEARTLSGNTTIETELVWEPGTE